MGLGSTTWLEAAPAVLAAALLLVVPGAVGARLTGLRWNTAVAVGPLLSTTTVTIAGVVAGAAGIRWGVLPLLAGVLALVAACALVGRLLRAHPEAGDDGSLWSLLVGAGLSSLVVALVVLPVSGRPTTFPQSPDTIFHLGTIQWMLERGDVSTLHASGFAASGPGGFYPAAFHAVATTVAQLTGSSPVVSASATSLVVGGVVWPLGVMLLARRVLGTGWWPTLAAALTSVAFSGFPFWMMGYGVLWPNGFGQALMPSALALVVVAVDGPVRARSALVATAALPGLAVAHPSALIAFLLVATVIAVAGLVRGAWRQRARPRAAVGLLGAALGVLLVVGVVWVAATRVSTAMRASNGPGPEMSVEDGLVDVAFFAPRLLLPLWGVGVAVAVGCIVLLVRRSQLWLVLAHGGVTALYLAITLVDSPHTRWFTWPWYNNSPRLGALMVLTGAVLAAAALTGVSDLVIGLLRRRRAQVSHARPVVALLVALAFVVGTAGLGIEAHRRALSPFFVTSGGGTWVSTSNLDALRTLGAKVSPGDVVAANPWRGGTYLYLTSNRSMLFPTEKSWTAGDRALLGRDLDKAATEPAVCATARRLGVTHVLTGGRLKTSSAGLKRRYAGIDAVPGADGFTQVGTAGDYTLYRLDACR